MSGEAMPLCYCISCSKNAEQSVANSIEKLIKDAVVLVPALERLEKHKGRWEKKQINLTPGYVFVYFRGQIPIEKINGLSNVNRVLFYYEDNEVNGNQPKCKSYILRGEDRLFAEWIYHNNGIIGVSKAIIDIDSRFKVLEGPLKDLCIIRFDKHNRKALVHGLFNNSIFDYWLSFDWK